MAYRYGMKKNHTVAMIQTRLKYLGYLDKSVDSTGNYMALTKAAVKKFQKAHGLEQDGVVGDQTWKALFPPVPKKQPIKAAIERLKAIRAITPAGWALKQSQKLATYGSTEASVRKQLVTVDFLGFDLKVHKKHAKQFEAVAADIKASAEYKKNPYKPKQAATFCWRKVRGGTSLSNHSFGIAIDLDWNTNPMTTNTTKIVAWKTSKGRLPQYVINAFKSNGFRWGGDYKVRKDFMHFEAGAWKG